MHPDLSKIKKVFFIGIGGVGISAIAKMMHLEGKVVLGSDIGENEMTALLKNDGIEIQIGQNIELIPKDVDLIVYTIAIPKYDPKFFEELKHTFQIPILSYPEMLGIVTDRKYTIAVAGTHGKTTTTAMIAKILMDSKLDPTVVIGSFLQGSTLNREKGRTLERTNYVGGKGKYLVVEGCEYRRSFLHLSPKI